jgi:hypothetical protein
VRVSLLLTRKMDCCCVEAKNVVLECFPVMCEEPEGDGWRRLFGYAAGQNRERLRFFTRVPEAVGLQLIQNDFPNRDFIWWDHELSGPQHAGGGQLWYLRKDPNIPSLARHKDFLYGNDAQFLPQDPRDFTNAEFPNGLRPPQNAFEIEGDGGANGVWLEVKMFTGYSTRRSISNDGFGNIPGRITNTHYDRFLIDTLAPNDLEPEFTLMDLNEIEVTQTDDGPVYEVGPEGWVADEFSGIPREANTLFTRANHLFHHIWNLCTANFNTFGGLDEFGIPRYIQPGLYGGQDADTPINIYFWQRWIAHADPTGSGLYELDFAMTFSIWTPTNHYNLHQFRFPNMPACGTSLVDAIAQLDDGTANCNRTEQFTEQFAGYPGEFHIAQQYFLSPEGGQFALTCAGPYEWPRPASDEATMPTYPLGLKNKIGGTPSQQCSDPETYCSDEWLMIRGNAVSAKITFEFKRHELMILGSPEPGANDGLNLLNGGADPTKSLGFGTGSIDHWDIEDVDQSGISDRVFAWPTAALGRKQIMINGTATPDFADACAFSPATNPFVQTGLPGTEIQEIKFKICDLLTENLAVDCHTDRGPDIGPVVHMDGQVYTRHADYFHVGLDMSELYSTCGNKGLTPNFRGSENMAQRIKLNGPWPVVHVTDFISVYFEDGGTNCTTTGSISGCNPNTACACKPTEICGEDAGFNQNIGVTPTGCTGGNGYLSVRGIFTLGREPNTDFGTVTT